MPGPNDDIRSSQIFIQKILRQYRASLIRSKRPNRNQGMFYHTGSLSISQSVAYRFTYDYINCHLLVEMPTRIHEVPCTVFKTWFDRFLDSLDFDRTLIDTIVFMNAEVKTEELSTIPDMTLSVIVGNPHRPLKEAIPVLIETAFSQQTNPLMNKLRKQIRAKPEVLMVIATLIGETKPYHSPERSSTAWDTLLQETPARELSSFLDLQPLDSKPTDPITILGHQWLGLQTIDVWVWVRGDSPININLVTGPRTARGVSIPSLSRHSTN